MPRRFESTEVVLDSTGIEYGEDLQTLEDRYRPGQGPSSKCLSRYSSLDHTGNLRRISDHCLKFGDLSLIKHALHEEQERELAPEVEMERQVQRPPAATPHIHEAHPDLRSFISTGILNRSSDAFMPAFQSLKDTSATSFLDVSEFPPELLVTRDFSNTIQKSSGSKFITDSFQRPVQ